MPKLFAFILFYLTIGCLSTSVYAEMYMWTDEKGIKHFSNTALNEQGKNIKQEGEIKFDEAKYQEILEQQKAYEEQQSAEKTTREEKVRKVDESGYQNSSTLTLVQTPRENNSGKTLENQKRKEYEKEVQRVNKYNKEVNEYNSQQNQGISSIKPAPLPPVFRPDNTPLNDRKEKPAPLPAAFRKP